MAKLNLVTDEATDSEDDGEESDDSSDDGIPPVDVDVSGHPLLPQGVPARDVKARQDVVREIFRKAYSRFRLLCSCFIHFCLFFSSCFQQTEGISALASLGQVPGGISGCRLSS